MWKFLSQGRQLRSLDHLRVQIWATVHVMTALHFYHLLASCGADANPLSFKNCSTALIFAVCSLPFQPSNTLWEADPIAM